MKSYGGLSNRHRRLQLPTGQGPPPDACRQLFSAERRRRSLSLSPPLLCRPTQPVQGLVHDGQALADHAFDRSFHVVRLIECRAHELLTTLVGRPILS